MNVMRKDVFVLSLLIFVSKSVDCKIVHNEKVHRNGIFTEKSIKSHAQQNSATQLAFKHCQESFKWEKWNCPSFSFFSKLSSNVIDREQAFVKALTTASHIYSMSMNCTKKPSTQCDLWPHENDILTTYHPRDLLSYANFHNTRAAKLAIRNSFRKLCRCHGMSGSCSMQTCWQSLSSFSVVTEDIKRMYDTSVLIQLDNFGRIDIDNVRDDQLVYLVDSPDYCIPNIIPKWKGTKNRQCTKGNFESAIKNGKNSCKNLCKSCGLSVKKYQKKIQRKCNFKFDWNSSITFELCDDVVTEYFCE